MVEGEAAASIRQFADQPVRLQRIGKPGFRPSLGDAASDRLFVHPLAPFVEQGQLAARLLQAAFQPSQLSRGGTGMNCPIRHRFHFDFLVNPSDHGAHTRSKERPGEY